MTNIKDYWYDETRGKITQTGIDKVAESVSNDYCERWNFKRGKILTVVVKE